MHIILSAVAGYLLGSIPFGYLLVRAVCDRDIRTTGSGNIGATNVARTSPMLGLITLALDMLKGAAAVVLIRTIIPQDLTAAFAAAFAAICGHVFPLWLGFRGGKGVATAVGAFLLLSPRAILVATAVFLAVALAFRFISLASIVAAACLPLCAYMMASNQNFRELALISAGSVVVIFKHHQNIRRLLTGVEPRFGIKRR
ncbi:MAG: glycerol-3-phosphate 1-O-acyltransferase PlsY [Acidobacteria bacterium]|nr:glycerol-3-phosphate 1-O-acyltransferase PlsY [Acidobacteriota bacterium]